jgi:hypothetical protein
MVDSDLQRPLATQAADLAISGVRYYHHGNDSDIMAISWEYQGNIMVIYDNPSFTIHPSYYHPIVG